MPQTHSHLLHLALLSRRLVSGDKIRDAQIWAYTSQTHLEVFKKQTVVLPPQVLTQYVWGGAQTLEFLTSSRVIQMVLSQSPDFENH